MTVREFSHGEPPFDVRLELKWVGGDLLAVVTGGTRPHIGAVCFAEPQGAVHPVTGEAAGAGGRQNAAPTVVSGRGHKDGVLAEMFAAALCEKHGVNVCCAAGVHVDGAGAKEIAQLVENAKILLGNACE